MKNAVRLITAGILVTLTLTAFGIDSNSTDPLDPSVLNEWQRVHPDGPATALGGPVWHPSYDSAGRATAVSAFGYLYHRDSLETPWVREEIVDGEQRLFAEKVVRSKVDDGFFYADVRNRGVMVRRGEDAPWEDALVTGGLIRTLDVAPSSEQIAYASRIITTYRTTDGGLSWSIVDAMEGLLRDLAISPADPSTLLLVLNSELRRSTDGGETTMPVSIAGAPGNVSFSNVEFNVVDPNIAVAIANVGSFRSTDGGQSWVPLALEPWSGEYFAEDIVFDPVAPDTMYIVARDDGSNVYRSSDGGMSWQTIADALSDERILYLAISNTGERLLGTTIGSYTAGPDEVFVPTNLGWSDVVFNAVTQAPPTIADALYASSNESGLVALGPVVTDWRFGNTGLFDTRVRNVWVNRSVPQSLLLATPELIFRSFDTGFTWALISLIDVNGLVREIVPSDDGSIIFAVRRRDDLLRSTSGGQLWESVLDGDLLAGRDQYPVLIGSRMDGTVYAGTQQSGTLKSTDWGDTWNALETPFGLGAAVQLRSDPFNPDGLYALIDANDPWYSPDAGVTWEILNTDGLPTTLVADMAIDPFESGRVYLAFDNRSVLYERVPATNSWNGRPTPRGIECRDFTSCRFYPDPNQRGRILLTTSGELYSLQRDDDTDAVGDNIDNCLGTSNSAQRDTDDDGFGNACDADIAPANNDCVVNILDLASFREAFGTVPGDTNWNPDADFSGDDQINVVDLGRLRLLFFGAPGPSSLASCDGSRSTSL